MNKGEFDKLDKKEKQHNATNALAWFCVITELNPMFSMFMKQGVEDEIETIKIILGKYMREELKEVGAEND